VVQQPGWWRAEQDDTVTKGTTFWQCYSHRSACLGSNQSDITAGAPPIGSQCEVGHTGPVCALCEDGWVMRSRECRECTEDPAANIGIVAGLAAVVIASCVLAFRYRQRLGISSYLPSVKIVVGFYSLLALAGQTFAIAWPAGFQSVQEVLQAAFASIADTSALTCAVPIDWFDKVYNWCGVLAAVTGAIWLHYRHTRCDLDPDTTAADGNAAESELRVEYSGFAFNAALLLYPFLSPAAVSVFNCLPVDGVLYLEADYTIRCDSDSYLAAQISSSFICVFYVFGLPAFCAYSIWRREPAVTFLAEGYRTDKGRVVLGWEVIEMVRKFILTSAVIFFNEGSSMQVATAVLGSIFFLVLHVCYLPFADSSDNWLQGLALVALLLVYFIGLLIKVYIQD
jgi:hypothetical protein